MRLASENFDFWPLPTTRVGVVNEDDTHARNGPSCAAVPQGGALAIAEMRVTPELDRALFYRCAFRVSALPAAHMALARIRDNTNTILEIFLTEEGHVGLWAPVEEKNPPGSVIVAPNAWFVVEVKLLVPTEGEGKLSWRVNGVELTTDWEGHFRNLGAKAFWLGNPGAVTAAATTYLDDAAINDDTGRKNNSWVGLEPDPTPERRKVYIGADIAETEADPHPSTPAPYDEGIWDRFEEAAGKAMGIIHFADPWNDEDGITWDGYGAGASDAVHARGAIGMKSLGGPAEVIQKVNSGVFDATIRKWAEDARDFGHPFFLRLWWEMNGTWFNWGRQACEGAEYVAAWRRFHDIVAPIAPNVTFVWCPNALFQGHANPFGDEEKEIDAPGFWPGVGYVDWTAVDGYTGENPHKKLGFRPPNAVFVETYEVLQAEAPNLPIMICETAASEYVKDGGEPEPPAKAEWIRQLLGHMVPVEMPNIRAVCWFNWFIEEGGGRIDWPIQSSPSATESFAANIADEHYIGAPEAAGALRPLAKVPVPGGEQVFAAQPSTVPRSLDTIPKLSIPLRLRNGSLAVCEQDSQENVAGAVYAILAYERGSRIEDVDFGVEDPTFSEVPFDDREWREQIARYEPRAEIDTAEEALEDVETILVNVGLGA